MTSRRLRVGALLASTLILSVIIGGSCGVTTYLTQRTINQEFEEAAHREAILLIDAIYNSIATAAESGHAQQLIRMIELTNSSTKLQQLLIFSSQDGTIKQSMNPADVGKKISEVHSQVFLYVKDETRGRAYDDGRERQFCMVKPLFNQERCHGCHDKGKRVLGILDVCINMNDVRQRMARNRTIVYTTGAISGSAAIILAAAAIAVLIALMGKRSVKEEDP